MYLNRHRLGNHDLGGNSTATVLGARKRYYTYADGTTRFIMLDGNNPSSSAQRTFLERTLKAAKEPVRIVAMHQPVYTAGLHSSSYEDSVRAAARNSGSRRCHSSSGWAVSRQLPRLAAIRS